MRWPVCFLNVTEYNVTISRPEESVAAKSVLYSYTHAVLLILYVAIHLMYNICLLNNFPG